MLRIVLVKCEKCGKIYKKRMGGFIKGINDDLNICPQCKIKNIFSK